MKKIILMIALSILISCSNKSNNTQDNTAVNNANNNTAQNTNQTISQQTTAVRKKKPEFKNIYPIKPYTEEEIILGPVLKERNEPPFQDYCTHQRDKLAMILSHRKDDELIKRKQYFEQCAKQGM